MSHARIATLLALFAAAPSAQAARVKDVATVYGKAQNPLSGYGLVTGLYRTGDSPSNEAAIRALANRLQGMGFTLSPEDISSRNVAVVMVTARMPADARPGHLLDVEVSSAGDARSLEGGVLLLTPLFAANGVDFALAQGPVLVGGYNAQAAGTQSQKNHPTTGRIPQGAKVERENPNRLDLSVAERVQWLVHDPDFTTASRIAASMNDHLGGTPARPLDAGTVELVVPPDWSSQVVSLVAEVERLELEVDQPARVVVNERTGTVVMGADVRLDPVAVAHGGLSIQVRRRTQVSQPPALSGGSTVVYQDAEVEVEEGEGRVSLVEGATIGDLVTALNSLGVKPRDLISILQAVHAAGALHASVEVL